METELPANPDPFGKWPLKWRDIYIYDKVKYTDIAGQNTLTSSDKLDCDGVL